MKIRSLDKKKTPAAAKPPGKASARKPSFSYILQKGAVLLFWLLVWHFAAAALANRILLVSPFETAQALVRLTMQAGFWRSIAFSFCRIGAGFLLALLAGCLAAWLAFLLPFVEALLTPILLLIKAVPVASFVILALLWVSSRNLSVLISFLMVLPVVYTNLLAGIRQTDRGLLEMALVFQVSPLRRLRYIYLPGILPYLVSACSVGLGFCFKSGIAAEVIGLPDGSIGEKLYEAKLYLMTPDLFAWTFVIIMVSFLFEKLVMAAVRRVAAHISGTIGQAEP